MSWLFSQALVAAFSEGNSWDGEPCAQSSTNPMLHAYLHSDRMTDFCRPSRFGMTFAPLTDDRGEELLTWFRAGFRARTSAQPAGAQALPASARGCGLNSLASFARFDRDTCSWRTPQFSLLGGSELFSETWPRWGLMRAGECWELPKWAHRTDGIGSGLWPTPVAHDDGKTPEAHMAMKARMKGGARKTCTSLTVMVKGVERGLWPTPTVCGNYNRKGASKKSGDGLATAVSAAAYATPTALDWRSGKASAETMARNSRPLSEQIGGQLNPTWVEWLMGWPLGWTDLKPLEMDKFHSALRKLGAC